MADTRITPSVGTLSLQSGSRTVTGLAATLVLTGTLVGIVGLSAQITPNQGVMIATGQTPTTVVDARITPPSGSLVLTGTQPGGFYVNTGALTLTGATPSRVVGTVIAPSTGALLITVDTSLTPSSGALALSGIAPIFGTSVSRTPGAGALTLAGQPGVKGPAVIPGTGALWFGESVQVTPGVGTLTLTGTTPSELLDARRTPAVAALVLTGAAPSVQGNRFTPSTATLTLIASAPNLSFSVTPSTGALALTGVQPGLATDSLRAPATGALVLTGTTPVVGANAIIPPSGALVLTGTTPVLTTLITPATGTLILDGQPLGGQNTAITPTTVALLLTGQQALVSGRIDIEPSQGALALTGIAPTVVQQFDFSLTPGSGALSLAGSTPGIGFEIAPTTGDLSLQGYDVLIAGPVLTPDTASLALVGNQGSFAIDSGNRTVTPNTGELVLAGNTPAGDADRPRLTFEVPVRIAIVTPAPNSRGVVGAIMKQPIESFPIGIDFSRWFITGETIVSASVSSKDTAGIDSSLIVLTGPAAVSGSRMTIQCAGGVAGTRHVVQFRIGTSVGNVFEAELGLAVEAMQIADSFTKEPSETFVVALDFDNWCDDGEDLVAAVITASNTAGTDSTTQVITGNPGLFESRAAIRCLAGAAGGRHILHFIVTTVAGNVYAADLALAIEEV